jgi:hypothetical protein
MAVLCRRFGISRKTGYKILNRYNSCSLEGLTDRTRRPYRHANQLPVQIETLIVRSKQERPHWGEDFANGRRGLIRIFMHLRSARSMRIWIATSWSSAGDDGVIKLLARRYRSAISPMSCGVPTARASSCWPIAGTAIH